MPRDSSPVRPRRRHLDRSRRSASRPRDNQRSDYDDEDLPLSIPSSLDATQSASPAPNTPNKSDLPASPAQPSLHENSSASSTPSHRRTPRRRAPDRHHNHNHNHTHNLNHNHSHPHNHQKHHLDPDPTTDIENAAKKAVDAADDVALVLLLTTWANTLAEASHATAPAAQFESAFHASRALEIVTGDVLLSPRLANHPNIRRALVSLLARVLYGDPAVHDTFASALVQLNTRLAPLDDRDREANLRQRQLALRKVLTFLRDLAANISAYVNILPTSTQHLPDSTSRAPATKPSTAPAGPDPTKAVERSMDIWRRAVARLQGEMAIVLVLTNAQRALNTDFRSPVDDNFHELSVFYVTVRDAVQAYISNDLAARRYDLAEVFWPAVLEGADNTVFAAARSRASMWLSQFESACRDVETQLDDAGIGFGPPARVSNDKFSVLVSASAGVAALVSCHQHSFTWANDTARLLSSMVTAFRCLERVAGRTLIPSEHLRTTFFGGLDGAFAAIDEVVNWSFSSLHDKVLGSLEKSCSTDKQVGDTNPPKVRHLRFEEPPKPPSKQTRTDRSGVPPLQNRIKPRHQRMKSSPDALLHLNAPIMSDGATSDGTSEENNVSREVPNVSGDRKDVSKENGDDDLPVVYEGKPLECDDDDEDDDDRDIIVHENADDSTKTHRKLGPSHMRSMSVDGIPF